MTAKSPCRQVQGRQTKRAAQAAGIERVQRFEAARAEWIAEHPRASRSEYQGAMDALARRLMPG